MVVGGSTILVVPSEFAAMAAGLLAAAVVGGMLCMVARKPLCHCRKTSLPPEAALLLIHRSFWPPSELLPGPVRNCTCFVLLIQVVEIVAKNKRSRDFGC